MEATCTNSHLPEVWKTEFAKMRPLMPGILQVAVAVAIIVTGCFGEAGIGTPWWSGIMFLTAGISLLILALMKQTVKWERCAFITAILSTIVSVLAIGLYCLEFALATLPQSPFPHHGISNTRLVRHYKVVTAELALPLSLECVAGSCIYYRKLGRHCYNERILLMSWALDYGRSSHQEYTYP